MRRYCLIIAVLSAAVAIVVLSAAQHPKPELMFEGKPLSQWLDNGFEDASRALYDLGTDCVPCIFEKLKQEHPQYSPRARFQAAWQRLPHACRRFFPRPKPTGFDQQRACEALLAIGPAVVPMLSDALVQDGNFLVRSVSAQTLLIFQQRGRNIARAYPALNRALNDPAVEVRKFAAQAAQARAGSPPREG